MQRRAHIQRNSRAEVEGVVVIWELLCSHGGVWEKRGRQLNWLNTVAIPKYRQGMGSTV